MILQLLSVIILLVAVGVHYSRRPGPEGLGYYSTTGDVKAKFGSAFLENKNIIVTGGYSGIGQVTAASLAEAPGTSVWLPARHSSMKRCQAVAVEITKKTGNPRVYCEPLDLSSFPSVKEFSENWLKKNIPLDILINNAGVFAPYSETPEGNEIMFATNHLGPFLLTVSLVPSLRKSSPRARVVNVASDAHQIQHVHFEDLNGGQTWRNPVGTLWHTLLGNTTSHLFFDFKGYGQSKSANILFGRELPRRFPFLDSYSLHPGAIRTNLGNQQQGDGPSWLDRLVDMVAKVTLWKDQDQGSSTTLYALLAPNLENGGYYCNCQPCTHADYVVDDAGAAKLWELSEELVKNFRLPSN